MLGDRGHEMALSPTNQGLGGQLLVQQVHLPTLWTPP